MATSKTAKKKKTEPERASPDDPRVTALLEALLADPKLAPSATAYLKAKAKGGGRKFGSNGLKVGAKLFALFTQGHLVVSEAKDPTVQARSPAYRALRFAPCHRDGEVTSSRASP